VTWVVWIDCTEAEAAEADIPGLTLGAHELDGGGWRLEAYLETRPGDEVFLALAAAVPSASAVPGVRKLAERDWVKYSAGSMTPVRAGRFHIYTSAHAASLRPGRIGIRIEAGRAFGTGHHATTLGCLGAIDRAARRTQKVGRALDLGTGTGVLALAIAKRWRRARVVASDIDPVAIEVARENLRMNRATHGIGTGRIDTFTATGMGHKRLAGTFDLITANILARPLVAMAQPISEALAPGGRLVLAGLLERQARRVAAAYLARGLVLARKPRNTAWPVLEFTRTR